MRRARIVWVGAALCALAAGCPKRTLDSHGPGTIAVDGGGASGGGAAGGGDTGAGGLDGGTDRGRLVPLPLGQPCTSNGDCSGGICADGICCTVACTNECKRCNLPSSIGSCVYVPAGGAPRTPSGCLGQPSSTCGLDGTCDGAGACRLWPESTICGAGSCDGDTVVGQMVCDGIGHCKPASTRICVPYRCDPFTATCRTDCATDADCPGSICEATGRCHINTASACQSSGQCASGFCAQGVCCNRACDDPCLSCNLPGREGNCSPRPTGCPGDGGGTD